MTKYDQIRSVLSEGGGVAEAKSFTRLQTANLKPRSEGCRKAGAPFEGKGVLVAKPSQGQSSWPPDAQSRPLSTRVRAKACHLPEVPSGSKNEPDDL